jgi:uncharacterized protein YoxC
MNWDKKFTKFIGSKESVIIHTVFFLGTFALPFFGAHLDTVLLFLTTIVSLEAIYLAIFIQISVNQNTESLEDVEEDIEDIAEGVEEISEDIEDIAEDVEDIAEDVDEMEKDSDDMVKVEKQESIDLENIQTTLKKLLEEVERLKK